MKIDDLSYSNIVNIIQGEEIMPPPTLSFLEHPHVIKKNFLCN